MQWQRGLSSLLSYPDTTHFEDVSTAARCRCPQVSKPVRQTLFVEVSETSKCKSAVGAFVDITAASAAAAVAVAAGAGIAILIFVIVIAIQPCTVVLTSVARTSSSHPS